MSSQKSAQPLVTTAWREVENPVQTFEDAWRTGQRPAIEDHLPAMKEGRRHALVELVRVDLEMRLKASEAARVEDYLARFPELADSARQVCELLTAEYLLRRQREADLTLKEYQQRFPEHVAELANYLPGGPPTLPDGTPADASSFEGSLPRQPSNSPSIPGYEILAELGRGGMGVVYKARHLKLKRLVALKMILSGVHAAGQELSRFRTEAEAIAQLQHPNIVQVFEIGEYHGLPFFSLEYANSGSLAKALGGNPQDPKESARVLETLAWAVQAAHQRGIVHRDLKPANVLLQISDCKSPIEKTIHDLESPKSGKSEICNLQSAILKITDFGLAKRLDDDSGQTQTGAVMGTPSYMAPEQAEGKVKELGPAVDNYSLGAILYEMLTGRPPFKAASVLDTLELVRTQEPVPPSRLQPGVPRDLETICLKCLQKEPHKRYGSAGELAGDLRRFQAGEPITARPVGYVEGAVKWARRHPARAGLIAAVAVAVLAMVGGTIGMVYQQELAGLNDELTIAKAGLEESLDREQGLSSKLRDALKTAEDARDAETKAKDDLDQVLYFRRVGQALAQWKDNEIESSQRLLEECPPQRRHWEWHYVYRLWHLELLTFKGHKGGIICVAFSPDGTKVASGSTDSTVKVWDAASGQEILTLRGHTKAIYSVTFSPDSKKIASASNDNTVKVWDAASGQEILTLKGHAYVVFSVAFSPDGKRLASASHDTTVKVWDAVTGQETLTIRNAGNGRSVAFSPDGKRLASTGNTTVKVWDATTGQETLIVKGHKGSILSVAFSPDGKRLASASNDGTVKIWNATTAQEAATLKGHSGYVTSVAYSPDGKRLASASNDKTVKVWDAVTGQEILTLKGFGRSVAFSPDGQRLAAGWDTTVKVWDASWNTTAKLRNVATGQEAFTLKADKKYTRAVMSVVFGPDGKRLASAEWDKVDVRDAATGEEVLALKGHRHKVLSVAYNSDGTRIATASNDKTVKVWDADTGKEFRTLEGHTDSVVGVAFGPDGARIVSASTDKTVKVWDAATGHERHTFRGHTAPIHSVAYSPCGKFIASGSMDNTVKVWDADSGQEISTLRGHKGTVLSVAFSPDGKRVASGCYGDNTAKVWDTVTGQETLTLRGHTGPVQSVAFSPDGKRLASAGSDATVKIWDAVTGQEALTLKAHSDIVHSVAFSSDGKRLASASNDGTVKVWDARSGKW